MVRNRWCLSVLASAYFAVALSAQIVDPQGPPEPFVPQRPPSQQEQDRREALKLYSEGLLHQRADRLLEAVRTFEQAAKLDPDAAPVYRALIPLYIALSRAEDALAACKRIVQLVPTDHETWYLYGRQLKENGRPKEAIQALTQGIACPNVKDQADLYVQFRFDLANLYEETKEFDKAATAFRALAQALRDKREALIELGPFTSAMLDAEEARVFERIGQVCIEGKQFARAVEAFGEAQNIIEKRLFDLGRARQIDNHLAQVWIAQNQPAKALVHLEAYLKSQPADPQPYELFVSLLQKLGRDREVLPSLERLAERDKHNLALHLLLARQFGRERRVEEAKRLYQQLLQEHMTPEVYRGYFQLLRDHGQMAEAVRLLDEAIRVADADDRPLGDTGQSAVRARSMLAVLRDDPEMVKAIIPLATEELYRRRPMARGTWRYLAVLAARTKQLDAAEAMYRHCLQFVNRRTEQEVYSGLLEVLWEQRKFDEIIQTCDQGIERAQATTLELFHTQRAMALLRVGRNEEAVAAAEEATKVARDATRLRIRRLKVDVLRQAGRLTDAEKECLEMLKEFALPGEVRDVRYTLSHVYTTAKAYPKAEEQLRLVLETDPRDATACNDLGYILADQNRNLEEAEQLIRKAIDLDRETRKRGGAVHVEGDKDNAAYLDSLGWVLFRRGQFEEARQWLEKAAELSAGGEDPVIWDHLGDVYFRLDQLGRAQSSYRKAAELYEGEKRRRMDDHYKELKTKLQLLERELQTRP